MRPPERRLATLTKDMLCTSGKLKMSDILASSSSSSTTTTATTTTTTTTTAAAAAAAAATTTTTTTTTAFFPFWGVAGRRESVLPASSSSYLFLFLLGWVGE